MKKIFLPIGGLLLSQIAAFAGSVDVLAYEIETLPDTSVENDIVLGPGKIEVSLDPGESVEKTIYFTNRTGKTVDFTVDVEDFTGSRDVLTTTVFLGDQKSPYSLRDYLNPDIWQFRLEHSQRIALPVKISIPGDAEPGGKYGVIFAAAEPPTIDNEKSDDKTASVVGISARVGCLFFVRVNGDAEEDGALKNFSTLGNRSYFENGPIDFQVTYENNGNVHLSPYGYIAVSNLTGAEVARVEIEPYFAMPDSERLHQAIWDKNFLLGKYTATIYLNRGYQDIIDNKSVSFWVVPWKLIAGVLLATGAVIWLFFWITGNFEIKKKTD